MSLDGKVAIITGAGSGIGKATAILFSKEKARLVLAGRRIAPLKETLSELKNAPDQALVVEADVSKPSDAKRIVDETLRKFGRLDILVNNAGVEGPHKAVDEMTEEEWNGVMDINLKGVFLCSKFAIPAMRKNGRGVITSLSSNWAIVGAPGSGAYCASKAGVMLLSKAMAIDHAKDGIVVNCICPGDVDTPLNRRILESGPEDDAKARLAKMISPEEIAHGILFLVSDDSTVTTGTALVMDNGSTAVEGSALLPSRKPRPPLRKPTNS